PVLSRMQRALWLCILRARISAYTDAWRDMNGAPKQAENAACGSVIPTSVPASFEVKPDTKWYITLFSSSTDIGGRTPNASAVNKTMVCGCGPRAPRATLGLADSG